MATLEIRIAGSCVTLLPAKLPKKRKVARVETLVFGGTHAPRLCIPIRQTGPLLSSVSNRRWPRTECLYVGKDSNEYAMLDITGWVIETKNKGGVKIGSKDKVLDIAKLLELGGQPAEPLDKVRNCGGVAARFVAYSGKLSQAMLSSFIAEGYPDENGDPRFESKVAREARVVIKRPKDKFVALTFRSSVEAEPLTMRFEGNVVCYLVSLCGWDGRREATELDMEAARLLLPDAKFESLRVQQGLSQHAGTDICNNSQYTYV